MLDIGTSGNTNSRIRCNADVNGYAGYAEMGAASSYDMFLNLSTTRTDGGWVYFKINNDGFVQLSSSGNKVNIHKDTAISGNLDVGVGAAQTSIKAHVNHAGHQGNIQIEARWRSEGFIHFNTNHSQGYMFLVATDSLYQYCGNNNVYFAKPTTNASDDRLKGNEELIGNACEILSKLRPQLYDKKPDMENDDPTAWYKESGLIAQGTYYDAQESRHVTHKSKPETAEEGNVIPLPEIPTSIDPRQDPDYSSWGEESAPVSYIGLIAYLVKANNELHERVKALETK